MSTLERKHLTEPSPSDWERWVARLADGEEPATAARAEGQTCTSFRRNNAEAHAEALALSRQARAAEADLQGERWALADDASDAMRLAWLKRWNGEWAGTQKLEVEHTGGVEVVVEHDYDRILDKLAEVGLIRRREEAAADAAPLPLLPARTN